MQMVFHPQRQTAPIRHHNQLEGDVPHRRPPTLCLTIPSLYGDDLLGGGCDARDETKTPSWSVG
jgi:hypothetical protein